MIKIVVLGLCLAAVAKGKPRTKKHRRLYLHNSICIWYDQNHIRWTKM